MANLGREPLEIVELDVPFCTRTYGTSPCTAALSALTPEKCWNTFRTCQDTAHYSASPLTLRFSRSQTGLPKGSTIFPALAGVRRQTAGVNLAGADRTQGPLGTRARVTVTLRDFPYHDRLTDKYAAQRISGAASYTGATYDPAAEGTFFGRLRARWPFYLGASLRVKSGYVGQSLGAMATRHYVVSEWSGPAPDGTVTIVAKDVLDLADNKKALCPAPTSGQLLNDMPAGSSAAVQIDDATGYPTSGYAMIGDEIIAFTRSGTTITPTLRGLYGSSDAAHNAGDALQLCAVYADRRPDQVISDLLTTYAGVPSGFIPATEWQDEFLRWQAGFRLNRVITKPTGVQELIGEVLELGIILYWDDEAQVIRLRVNRPLDLTETAPALSDGKTILEDTAEVEVLDDQRLSGVLFFHGVLNYAKSTKEGENYRRAYTAVTSVGYDQSQYRTVLMPWLGEAGDDTIARAVAGRMLSRYTYAPRQVSFDADIKDKGDLSISQLVYLQARQLMDPAGRNTPVQMQVISAVETDAGHRLSVTAQEFEFALRYGFILPDGTPAYDSASAAQKGEGAFVIADGSNQFADLGEAYRIF